MERLKIYCSICNILRIRDWKGYDNEVGCQTCSAPVSNLVIWGNVDSQIENK